MSFDLFLRVLALCVALAGVETLHGIARTVLLAPRIGKARAVQLSVVSGTLLAFGVCALLVPGIGLQGARQHLFLGWRSPPSWPPSTWPSAAWCCA